MSQDRLNEVERALSRAKAAGSGRYDSYMRARAIVLPLRLARRLPLFGGAVVLSFVVIDPRVLSAPRQVLTFLLSHEWGHVEHGDVVMTYMALVAYWGLGAAYAGTHSVLAITAAILCIGVLALFLWRALSPRRELEADRFAVNVVGGAAAAEALDWLIEWRGEGWTTDIRRRGSRSVWARNHARRRLSTSGRSCSAAWPVFFWQTSRSPRRTIMHVVAVLGIGPIRVHALAFVALGSHGGRQAASCKIPLDFGGPKTGISGKPMAVVRHVANKIKCELTA